MLSARYGFQSFFQVPVQYWNRPRNCPDGAGARIAAGLPHHHAVQALGLDVVALAAAIFMIGIQSRSRSHAAICSSSST